LNEKQKRIFEEEHEIDLSFSWKFTSRFRANFYRQRGTIAGTLRQIPVDVPSLEALGLPDVVKSMVSRPQGLIFVTGPTGSGKSTTLAAMIDGINRTRRGHIVTIEDPIEFLHKHQRCLVNQREVGADTDSFSSALRYVLRQDPDVVLIGEVRDLESIEAALRISETGHLALATLHTNNTVQTIHRVLDFFPSDQQAMVRTQLSFVLSGILSQQLIPRADGSGRALALEVLVPNPAIRNLIRDDKTHQIYSQIQIGQREHGMMTLNQSLVELVRKNVVTREDAMRSSYDQQELQKLLS
jgi:twitching motility protein PilT